EFFQAEGPVQWAWPPELIDVAHLVRNIDPTLGADLLGDDVHREDRGQVGRTDGLHRAGVERRIERSGQIGGNVIPLAGQLTLTQDDTRISHQVTPPSTTAGPAGSGPGARTIPMVTS